MCRPPAGVTDEKCRIGHEHGERARNPSAHPQACGDRRIVERVRCQQLSPDPRLTSACGLAGSDARHPAASRGSTHRHPVRLQRLDHHMAVVRHPDPRMNPPPSHPARLTQGLEEKEPVITVAEDRPAAIAPLSDHSRSTPPKRAACNTPPSTHSAPAPAPPTPASAVPSPRDCAAADRGGRRVKVKAKTWSWRAVWSW